MKNIAISFKNVGKKYQRGKKLYFKQALLDLFKGAEKEYFWALKNINFNIYKGEKVGIIGINGSGKSTILKLASGVITPTEGEVNVLGKISPLIELGAGFHPELSGRENIYLNGAILGLKNDEIEEKFDSIVKFAELDDFIDTPVKHYSSGMYMRLGFAIAIHVEPDILLIDEILAVGDIGFQKKCLQKMEEFHQKGVTIVVVTHSMETIINFCDRAILISGGRLINQGKPDKIVKKYSELLGMQ